jgi:hypothetical protein
MRAGEYVTRAKLPSWSTVTLAISNGKTLDIVRCRARTDRDGFAYARPSQLTGAYRLFLDDEGTFWARGHNTPAARALEVLAALVEPL